MTRRWWVTAAAASIVLVVGVIAASRGEGPIVVDSVGHQWPPLDPRTQRTVGVALKTDEPSDASHTVEVAYGQGQRWQVVLYLTNTSPRDVRIVQAELPFAESRRLARLARWSNAQGAAPYLLRGRHPPYRIQLMPDELVLTFGLAGCDSVPAGWNEIVDAVRVTYVDRGRRRHVDLDLGGRVVVRGPDVCR